MKANEMIAATHQLGLNRDDSTNHSNHCLLHSSNRIQDVSSSALLAGPSRKAFDPHVFLPLLASMANNFQSRQLLYSIFS